MSRSILQYYPTSLPMPQMKVTADTPGRESYGECPLYESKLRNLKKLSKKFVNITGLLWPKKWIPANKIPAPHNNGTHRSSSRVSYIRSLASLSVTRCCFLFLRFE